MRSLTVFINVLQCLYFFKIPFLQSFANMCKLRVSRIDRGKITLILIVLAK